MRLRVAKPMLRDIKEFMRAKPMVTLEQLATHLHQDPETTRGLLAHWIRKGKVEKLPNPPGCGTRCQQCSAQFAEEYRWVDS